MRSALGNFEAISLKTLIKSIGVSGYGVGTAIAGACIVPSSSSTEALILRPPQSMLSVIIGEFAMC